ncbi:complement C1q-like protein 2 [Mya arenaria]|uniref:complement C1q-like protein 2 n=1 Tax=Mya arenaria TaxID=6604 RepID=UPI0022E56625|nr:complement C1q-like protein 2 [Mya arenaria]
MVFHQILLATVLLGSVTTHADDVDDDLRQEMALLKEVVRDQNVRLSAMAAILEKQEAFLSQVDALRQEVVQLRKEAGNKSRGRRQSEAAAFSAYHARQEVLHQGDTLKFSQPIYNEGSMYDPQTGVATAPMDGTYIFTMTIEHWETQELRCYLMADGTNMVDVIIYPNGRSTQSSNTAVLGLTSGQRVWVQCDDGQVFGSDGFRGTTFSGAYLY